MTTCMNCKVPTEEPRIFQGVLICDNCFRIVSRMVERTKTEMQMVFLAYTDILRVALIRGELRPPTVPDGDMARRDFAVSLQQMAQKLRDSNDSTTKGATGKGEVSDVRGGAVRSDGEVRSR